jgi:hypothetical protein
VLQGHSGRARHRPGPLPLVHGPCQHIPRLPQSSLAAQATRRKPRFQNRLENMCGIPAGGGRPAAGPAPERRCCTASARCARSRVREDLYTQSLTTALKASPRCS